MTSLLETPYHIDRVQTSKAVAVLGVVHVLVGYSLAGILARRRGGGCSYILTQTEHIAIVRIGKRHRLREIRKVVDIAGPRDVCSGNGELAGGLRASKAREQREK